MKKILDSIGRFVKNIFCDHVNNEVVAIVRHPESGQRFAGHECADCGEQWLSLDLPECPELSRRW